MFVYGCHMHDIEYQRAYLYLWAATLREYSLVHPTLIPSFLPPPSLTHTAKGGGRGSFIARLSRRQATKPQIPSHCADETQLKRLLLVCRDNPRVDGEEVCRGWVCQLLWLPSLLPQLPPPSGADPGFGDKLGKLQASWWSSSRQTARHSSFDHIADRTRGAGREKEEKELCSLAQSY